MIKAIFFDDGGVLNDNQLRGPEWQRLLPQFFVPKFGGSPERWREANVGVVEQEMTKIYHLEREKTEEIPKGFYDNQARQWLKYMFDELSIDLPNNAVQISREARSWITKQVVSSYPGTIDLIHELSKYVDLHTASNEESLELDGYLQSMGVRNHFTHLFGPDLIDTFKTGTKYYKKIARISNIEPSQGIIIDDKAKNLDFAKQVGFNTIHSGREGEKEGNHPYYTTTDQLQIILFEEFL